MLMCAAKELESGKLLSRIVVAEAMRIGYLRDCVAGCLDGFGCF